MADGDDEALELATTFGEDFELVATLPEDALAAVRETADVSLSVIGVVCEAEDGPTMDGEPLADRGYTHG